MTDAISSLPQNNVLVKVEDGIAWVSLNRPGKRNAINPGIVFEMNRVLDALEETDAVKCVVMTGSGDAFSAGMDLKEYFREPDAGPPVARERLNRANSAWQWRRLMYYPKPTIAMVNGWCFGGAFSPMVACDLAIAADEAQFGVSEVNWGIIPAGNVTKAVATTMGWRDSLYYIMTGLPFGGQKAAQMGLVNESVPRDQLKQRVRELADILLAKNPSVLKACKDTYKRVYNMDFGTAEDYITAKLEQMFQIDGMKGRNEGMRQFLDEKSLKPGLGTYDRKKGG